MRIDGQDHLYQHQQKMYPDGSIVGTTSYALPGRRFRPDVRFNPKDSNGFRDPSAYFVRFLDMTIGGTISYRTPDGTWGWDTDVSYPMGPWVTDVSAIPVSKETQLKTECLLQIKDQKINLALSLVFVKETSDMIWRRAIEMARIYDALKARNLPKARRLFRKAGYPISKRLSDNILEYQYGWRQLASDVMGAAQELDRGLRSRDSLIVARRSLRESESIVQEHKFVYTWYAIGNYTLKMEVQRFHRMSMWYRVNCDWSGKLSQLGLLNPAEVIADATPFSFAVNWVWPIVDYLSTIDATVGLSYLGGSYTRGNQCEGGTISVVPQSVDGTGSGSGTVNWYNMERIVIDDSVDPFYLKNPFAGSLQRALNALSLLGQKVGRR